MAIQDFELAFVAERDDGGDKGGVHPLSKKAIDRGDERLKRDSIHLAYSNECSPPRGATRSV